MQIRQVIKYFCQMFRYSPSKILGIWLLDFIYSGIIFAMPFLIGKAIDGLLEGKYLWFICLFIFLLVEVVFGLIYRVCDTRVYEKITVQFKEMYFLNAIEQGINTSEIDANSELIDEFSDFLHFFIIKIMTFFGVIVPFIYLYFEANNYVMLAAILTIIIVLFLQNPLQRDMQHEVSHIRDENEKRRNIIGKRDILSYRNFLDRVMDFNVKHSDKDAIAYIVSSFLQLGLLIFSVWHIVSSSLASAGVIFTTITYIMELNEKSLELPEIYADYLRLKDGINRIMR